MEANWEQGPLSEHALEPSSKFDLGYSEPMPKMQRTVHIRIGEGTQPFFLIGCTRLRCVDFERFLSSPARLCFFLKIDQEVAFPSLCDCTQRVCDGMQSDAR